MRCLALLALLLIVVSGDDSMEEDDDGCMISWMKDSIFMDRKFIKKIKQTLKAQMFGCLNISFPMNDVEFYVDNYTAPPNMFKIAKQCLKQTMKEPLQAIKMGNSPSRASFGQAWQTFVTCKLDSARVNFTNTSTGLDIADIQAFKDMWKFYEFTGDAMDLSKLKDIFNTCVDQRNGTTKFQIANSIDKCVAKEVIMHCQNKNRDVGVFLPIMTAIFTIADESPCASVQLPSQIPQYVQECVDQAKMAAKANSMNNSTDSAMESSMSMNGTMSQMNGTMSQMNGTMSQMNDTMSQMNGNMGKMNKKGKIDMVRNILENFFKNIVMNSTGCVGEKMGFYNSTADKYDTNASVSFVKNLSGWQSDQLKNSVVKIMQNCTGGNVDYYNDEGTSEVERMKRFWNMKKQFEICFTPQFSNICGINNDLYSLFHPFLNPNIAEIYMKALMEIGGKDALQILDMVKKGISVLSSGL